MAQEEFVYPHRDVVVFRGREFPVPGLRQVWEAEVVARQAEAENAERERAFLDRFPPTGVHSEGYRFAAVNLEIIRPSIQDVQTTHLGHLEVLRNPETRHSVPTIFTYAPDQQQVMLEHIAAGWDQLARGAVVHLDLARLNDRVPMPNLADVSSGLAEQYDVGEDTLVVVHAPHRQYWQRLLADLPTEGDPTPVAILIPEEK
ncbi:MAG TPA: hypothetical protein VFZ48_04465 [Candidatus Saccharimonadales bacterium]